MHVSLILRIQTSWNSGHVALALASSLSGELPLSSEDLVSEEERCNHGKVPRIIKYSNKLYNVRICTEKIATLNSFFL